MLRCFIFKIIILHQVFVVEKIFNYFESIFKAARYADACEIHREPMPLIANPAKRVMIYVYKLPFARWIEEGGDEGGAQ